MKTNHIYQEDSLSVLKTFSDECIDLIITSPPYYQLRKYSQDSNEVGREKTVEEYVKRLTIIFQEAKRVLKKSGSFWLNISDVYGGSGAKSQKDLLGSKERKKEIDSFPVGQSKNVNPQSLLGVPEQLMLSLIADGWILRNKCIWAKSMIDKKGETTGGCMPSPCTSRFNQNGFEYFYFFTKSKDYYFNADAVRVPYKPLSEKRIQAGFSDYVSFDYKQRPSKQTEAEYRYNLRANKTYNTKKGSQKIWEKKTKIPKESAENFGSPRARYHRLANTGKNNKEPYQNKRLLNSRF